MNEEQQNKFIPYMVEALRRDYNLAVGSKTSLRHLELLLAFSRSNEGKRVIPDDCIKPICESLSIPKRRQAYFCSNFRITIILFTYAMLQHERLPGAPKAPLQKKGVDKTLLRIRSRAAELERLLLTLSETQAAILKKAITLNTPLAKLFSPTNSLQQAVESVALLRGAATLCTTPFASGEGKSAGELRYKVLGVSDANPEAETDSEKTSLISHVIFKSAADDDNEARLLVTVTEVLADKTLTYRPVGWLQGRIPLTGTTDIAVNPWRVRPDLIKAIYDILANDPHSFDGQPPQDFESTLKRRVLIKRLIELAERSEAIVQPTPEQPIKKKDSLAAVRNATRIALELIYELKQEDGDPRRIGDEAVNHLVSEAMAARGAPEAAGNDLRNDSQFFTKMINQHLGYRVS